MTWFDLIVLAILGLSILFATIRGFSREMTTLVALAVGILAAYYLAPPLGELFGSGSTMTAIILYLVMLAVFFIASLVLLNILVSRFIAEKPGRIDRVLGVGFGFIRGYILVGLLFLALDYYFEDDRQPAAITDAVTHGVAASAGELLENMGLESVTTTAEDMSDLAMKPIAKWQS